MNTELYRRWKSREAPFCGVTVTHARYEELSAVRMALKDCSLEFAFNRVQIYQLEDWHSHDDYISEAGPLAWSEFGSQIESDAALAGVCSDDTYVRHGYYTSLFDAYMRVHVARYDEYVWLHAPDSCLEFPALLDMTCMTDRVEVVTGVFNGAGLSPVMVTPAGEFFDACYAG